MSTRFKCSLPLVILFVLALAIPVFGQTFGEVTGRIMDSSGGSDSGRERISDERRDER
jgi:hypothetical protein